MPKDAAAAATHVWFDIHACGGESSPVHKAPYAAHASSQLSPSSPSTTVWLSPLQFVVS